MLILWENTFCSTCPTKKFSHNLTSQWQSQVKFHAYPFSFQFSSVQLLSHVWLCYPMGRSTPGLLVHYQLLEFNSNSCPLNWWCHPTISSSVIPFSRLQSFPASGSFQMSQPFSSGGQSIGVSASASILPMNTQDWSSLGWTGWVSLQSKGLSRVFSNTTVQKHQSFSAQLSL